MLSVEEARTMMLAAASPLAAETATLTNAHGRTLARPIVAQRDQPPFSASAMDGYAVRSSDTPGRLTVIGESAAGHGFAGRCESGMAVRISTGAAVPEGADTIVIQEDAELDGVFVDVPPTKAGQHIRAQAQDFMAGAVLLQPGQTLDGITLTFAAASGTHSLSVTRAPRIAILCSGDELSEPGTNPGPFQIFESGTHGIASLVRDWGGVPNRLKLEKDDADAIAHSAAQALEDCDLLVVIGGASVGPHDHARSALLQLGLELSCKKVAVRPGKPTWFGMTPRGPVLGLPGNPASALVCSYLFLRPLIETFLGRDPVGVTRLRPSRLEHPLPANGDREHYLRSRASIDATGQLVVQSFKNQDSSLLSVFAATNALIRLAPGAPESPQGSLVEILLLRDL